MMKKSMIFALICVLAFAVSGCGSSSNKETFIMADVQESGHPTAESCDRFAELVKERTNGRVEIEVYHGSTLGTEAVQTKQVSIGGIDFARVSTSQLSNYDDDLKAFQALYLFKDNGHMWRVLDGEIGTELLNSSKLQESGIYGLCWFSGGSRNFYNNQKEIHTPDDLAGLNLRVNTDPMFALLKNCKANGINIAYGDILNSINSGTIDGAENNWPSYISTDHYTAAKYITIDGHTRIPEMIVASSKVKERVSEKDWEIIVKCAQEVSQYQRGAMDSYDDKAIEKAKKSGCIITELNSSEMAAFQKAGEPVNAQISAKYIKLINRIQAVD